MFFKKKIFSSKGFSLLELLSAASITVVLSVVGIKSYRSQVNKAKTAEAQESLSYVYSTQRVFYNNWNTYHENLMVVGTIPSGIYNYDVGFTVEGHTAGGNLGDYPISLLLNVRECSTFNEICAGTCLSQVRTVLGSGYDGYFDSVNCEVIGRQNIKDCTDSECDAQADPSTFKAIATERLRNLDIWSINQNQQIVHEKEGT